MQYFTKYILLITIIFSCGNNFLYSQTTNPFEISSRLDSVSRLPQTLTIDTINSLELLSSDEVSEITLPDSTQTKVINPFDVDHLPLRKTKSLQAETEKNILSSDSDQNNTSHNFIFWLLLLASGLLAIVINLRFSMIHLVFRSLLNMNLFKLFQREEGSRFSLAQIFLYLVFFINVTTLVFLYLKMDKEVLHEKEWLYILLFITGFYLAKHLLIFISGNIFLIQKSTSLYNFSIFSYHTFAGIILLPLNLTAAFAPAGLSIFLIYTAIVFLSFVVVLKVGRGLFISLDFWSDRFFQFFMYLCTFEILPVLILVKFLLYHGNQ